MTLQNRSPDSTSKTSLMKRQRKHVSLAVDIFFAYLEATLLDTK